MNDCGEGKRLDCGVLKRDLRMTPEIVVVGLFPPPPDHRGRQPIISLFRLGLITPVPAITQPGRGKTLLTSGGGGGGGRSRHFWELR